MSFLIRIVCKLVKKSYVPNLKFVKIDATQSLENRQNKLQTKRNRPKTYFGLVFFNCLIKLVFKISLKEIYDRTVRRSDDNFEIWSTSIANVFSTLQFVALVVSFVFSTNTCSYISKNLIQLTKCSRFKRFVYTLFIFYR